MALNHSLRGLHLASVGNYQNGGRSFSPYMFRREIDFHPRYENMAESAQYDPLTSEASKILGVSNKISLKEGMCFRNSPIFQQLLDNPSCDMGVGGSSTSFSSGGNSMSHSELKEEVEEYQEEKDGKKEKRKRKRDPSVKEVREHLRMIIQYHEKEMERSIPSIYPVLGACGEDSSDEGGGDEGGRVFKAAASEPTKKKKRPSSSTATGKKPPSKRKANSGKKKKQ